MTLKLKYLSYRDKISLRKKIEEIIEMEGAITPRELAKKIGVSRKLLYRIIQQTNDYGHPIYEVLILRPRNKSYRVKEYMFNKPFYKNKLLTTSYKNLMLYALRNIRQNDSKTLQSLEYIVKHSWINNRRRIERNMENREQKNKKDMD